MISRLELQVTTVTHMLEKHGQQARIAARNHNHSHSTEPRTDMISRIELQQSTTVTHFLESQGQA